MASSKVLPFLALALGLGVACAPPAGPARIGAFVGKPIQAFLADSGLRPARVQKGADGTVYTFDVTTWEEVALPPAGPARPQNITNEPAPLGLGAPSAFQEPRVAPGTPAPAPLLKAPASTHHLLTVRTDPDDRIQAYTCLPLPRP
ncbi:hypothetical protein [Mesoterricola sediminis]|uniref:Uncharacterized protein n=1 Tax=Mesoterricola sediminis TaxID=2927980 RepID=A0AA48H527_9BACT|nr:hypothetical protein [Mesoterricola sediminis]BDU76108.1 hypothetical protein METESE_10660 [Mesoterricola sediminis]